jgi:hypothetical protein
MKYLRSLIKTERKHSIVLELLFTIYILFNIQTPYSLAKIIDTTLGNIFVVVLALTMFAAAGPIAGILALLASYSLINRSARATGGVYRHDENEAEELKMKMLEQYNEFPKTLEEEVVSDMAPIVRNDDDMQAVYKPVLNDLSDAAPIDYEGVI